MGIKPDTSGFPYYSPKPRTPHMMTEDHKSVVVATETAAEEERGVTPGSTGHAHRNKTKEVLTEMDVDNVSNNSSASFVRQLDFTANKLTNGIDHDIQIPTDEESIDSSIIKKPRTNQVTDNGPISIDNNSKDSKVSRVKTPQHRAESLQNRAEARSHSPSKRGKISSRGQSPSLRSHSSSISGSRRGPSPLCRGTSPLSEGREQSSLHEDNRGQSPPGGVMVDKGRLVRVYDSAVQCSSGWSLEQLLQLDSTLNQLVFRHRMNWDKTLLLDVS